MLKQSPFLLQSQKFCVPVLKLSGSARGVLHHLVINYIVG